MSILSFSLETGHYLHHSFSDWWLCFQCHSLTYCCTTPRNRRTRPRSTTRCLHSRSYWTGCTRTENWFHTRPFQILCEHWTVVTVLDKCTVLRTMYFIKISNQTSNCSKEHCICVWPVGLFITCFCFLLNHLVNLCQVLDVFLPCRIWPTLSKLLNNLQFHANQKDAPYELEKCEFSCAGHPST